ncbi:hypothetical protein XF30_11540 [Bradyrhizobium sp. SUTN9-2]|nr:hypothetical protein XF30_11540 [Bradyrhizobium sp. SUTN9-2]
MPASGDTLLRMIRAAEFKSPEAPRVVGIDDWAWRKGLRYGTIICDLERNRIIETFAGDSLYSAGLNLEPVRG